MDAEDINLIGFFTLSVILFFGIPGNIISFVVWTKGDNCSKSSSAIYFKLLAVCDLLVLLVPGMDYFLFLFPWNNIDLRLINNFLCKILTFATVFSRDISLGVTIALTIERALTVCLPISSYLTNVKKRANIIFLIITSLSLILNIPYIICEEIMENKHVRNISSTNSSQVDIVRRCTYLRDPEYVDYIELYNTIHFSCHVITPIIVLTFCNSLILRKLCKDKDQHFQADFKFIRKSIHSVTILVVCIGVIHIVSTLPMSLHVISHYYEFNLTPFWHAFANLIVQNLIFLNSGINCILYCFIGEEFRHDFRKLNKNCGTCLKYEHLCFKVKRRQISFETDS